MMPDEVAVGLAELAALAAGHGRLVPATSLSMKIIVTAAPRVLDDEDLAVWVAGLNDLFAGRCPRVEPRLQARAYVRGPLAPLASKNRSTLAEAAGNKTPDKMQRLLNRAGWDADGVRDDVRGYVARHLGDAGGVLVVDETGFVKKGTRSAGCSGSTRARPGGWRTAGWASSWPMPRAEGPRAGRPGDVPAEVVDGGPGPLPRGGRAR